MRRVIPGNFKNRSRFATDWLLRLFAVVFYVYMAWAFGLGLGDGLLLMFFWGLLYFIFIVRELHRSMYFKKHHLIIIGILALLLLLVYPGAFIPVVLIAAFYWFGVEKRQPSGAPYFVRYHLLNALVVNIILMMAFMLLVAGSGFLEALVGMTGLHLNVLAGAVAFSKPVVFLAVNGVFAVLALADRTPDIPWLSRHLNY